MARVILLISLIVIYVTADDLCICRNEESRNEVDNLWNFLIRLDSTVYKSDEDKTKNSIIPSVLSPNVPCSTCLERIRTKRKILPDPEDTYSKYVINPEDRSKESNHDVVVQDKKCPINYYRLGFWCLKQEDIAKGMRNKRHRMRR